MTLAAADTPVPSPWPDDDILVLRNRRLRAGTDVTTTSRFGDLEWILKPAHPDAHVNVSALRWRRFPSTLTPAFKAFFLAALDHPYPAGPRVQRPGHRPSVATFHYWVLDLLLFAQWLTDRGIHRLCDVTDHDLDAYRTHVLGLARVAGRKSDILAVIRTLWLYRRHLPPPAQLLTAYPWAELATKDLVTVPAPGRENKTPRIDAATMDALLAWALRMVENIGPDVVDAWNQYQQIQNGTHPEQAHFTGTLGDRLPVFLHRAREHGIPLPGRPRPDGTVTVNYGHVLRLVGIRKAQRAGISDAQKCLIKAAGLPVAADTYVGAITGRVADRPWRDRPITVQELPTLLRMVATAAFITVAYLSGMRPGEALNLPTYCRDTDPETGELLVRGHRGKGFDRSPLSPDDAQPTRPWVVVQPVHDAITLMERLGDRPFLFPASLISAHPDRPNMSNARSSAAINQDMEDFRAWVNTAFYRTDGKPSIPADATKHLHASRLRRTLAYFIVRRPRGLIAATLQYGHVNSKVTLAYAGSGDTSWMHDVAVERLEQLLEQVEQDAALLTAGEHISGPSAAEYGRRVARFTGRVVTNIRNAERLLSSVDPGIHHGEAMTCVWRAETAACRQARIADGLPAIEAPDDSDCRSECANLAFTDRDVTEQRERLAAWSVDAADPLTPRPLRDRAAALAARARYLIDRHDNSRPEPDPQPKDGC